MALDIARVNGQPRDLAHPEPSPVESFELLDVVAGGISQEAPRQEWIATISAGERGPSREGKPGLPQRSTDGTIFLHDDTNRAPALRAALEATSFKSLTIAFPWDDPNDFIRQRFVQRSATSLLSYGDQHAIRVIETKGGQTTHTEYLAGTDGYARAVAQCKVEVSVFFALAEWVGDVPEIVFPDGWGALYRLRFTSRNSLRSIANTLKDVAKFTDGKVRGIPFELRIDYREVADGTGTKRRIPVWVIAMKTPQALRLSSRNFRAIVSGAIDQGRGLMLPPASQETLEMAALEPLETDMDEPTDDDVALLQRGGRCDALAFERHWFAAVKGSSLASDEGRAQFISWYTGGQTDSLARFLTGATDAEATDLLAEVALYVLDRTNREAANAPLPSAVDTGTLDRNQFLEQAYAQYGYSDKLEVAKALGLTTLNAWTAKGKTWNDALAELERIAAAPKPGSVAEYEEGWLQDANAALADEPEGEPESEFDTLLAEHQATTVQQPVSDLHALWLDYDQTVSVAESLGVSTGQRPPKSATLDQLRGYHRALARKVEQAQRQVSFS